MPIADFMAAHERQRAERAAQTEQFRKQRELETFPVHLARDFGADIASDITVAGGEDGIVKGTFTYQNRQFVVKRSDSYWFLNGQELCAIGEAHHEARRVFGNAVMVALQETEKPLQPAPAPTPTPPVPE